MNQFQPPPVPTAPELARNRAQLLEKIATRPDVRRRRQRVTAGISAAILLGGATAGAIAITASPREIAHSVYCYSAPSTASRHTQVAGADQAPLSHQNFFEACSAVWRADVFELNRPGNTVPELHACLGRNDVVSIFPIEEVTNPAALCKDLGLREAQSTASN